MKVTTAGGVMKQEFEGTPERVLERVAVLASVVPKEATWEGTEHWKPAKRKPAEEPAPTG